MENRLAIDALTALAQQTRLDVFRRLIKAHPDEIAAGEIARACKVPHNTMSTHLAVLARANLIRLRREGRAIYYGVDLEGFYYGVDLEGFRSLIGFLTRDCCAGRAEICAPLIAELSCCVPTRKPERVRG
jgi:ArsR family transcriptional regulator, arsenate/arsenite/antimonite-responsive transcriptional repressor